MIDFHIDHVTRRSIQLWAWCPEAPEDVVSVDIFVNDILVGRFDANETRLDLLAAGKGTGRYGLLKDISVYSAMFAPGIPLNVSIFAISPVQQMLGSRRVTESDVDLASISPNKLETMRSLFAAGVGLLRRDLPLQPESQEPDPNPLYERLLAPARSPAEMADAPPGNELYLSNYCEYSRFRFKVDKSFQTELGKVEINNYYKWYLESYSPMRGLNRAPLSSYEIEYLNELVIIGGRKYHLSRATYIFLHDNPDLLSRMDLNSFDYYFTVIYWWAIERARSLYVEDCLVPPSYKAALGSVSTSWQSAPFPPTRFLETYFNRQPSWHFLDLMAVADRVLVYVAILLAARTNAYVLEYVPKSWLYRLSAATSDQPSLFVRACDLIFHADAGFFHDYGCEQILHFYGFNLGASRSLTISPKSHRIMAASLPRPLANPNPRHVQLIGPMDSTSGLGQAARLSANTLKETSFSHSAVTFSLDNPAPVGYANEVAVSKLSCPAINLIHLNAESIPLALAYMPDVFSDAYNIGYFFWELDSPAKCHYLALDLLDEVWVSSQYGVDIYAPHTSKPVVNVGMAVEDVPPVDRAAAREFLSRRVGIKPSEFVFLATFDSYSFIQRKNPHAVVRAFKHAFRNNESVRLVLKTHNKDFVGDPVQVRSWQSLNEEIQSDPRIVLVNETLRYDDLMMLKAGCDAYVSLHRSEGWGFGLVEAMNLGVPVIATGYSGNMEFCNPDTAWLVDYDLKVLDPDDYIFVVSGQRWAEPKIASAAQQMLAVFSQPDQRKARAAAALAHVKNNFSVGAIAKRYAARLDAILQQRTAVQPKQKRQRSRPG